MTDTMQTFKVTILVMLFYSFGITLLAYAIPNDAKTYITSFSDLAQDISLQETGNKVQDSLESQTNIPIIELGALVFYSGNILLDLILNFIFAVPEMVGLLIQGLLFLINVDSYIWATVQLFSSVVLIVMYFIGLMQMLTGIRSGRALT